MIEADTFAFMADFNDLRRVFPLRGEPYEIQQVGIAYFKAMRRFPLSAVSAGKDAWLVHGKRFPKPAEWIESIPPKPKSATIPALTELERVEYQRAETLGYEHDPCTCQACQAAGVTHRFLRFVPDVDADHRDVKGTIGDRVVTRGHWAHGDELKRWYAAREAFFATCDRLGLRTTLEQRQANRPSFEQMIERIFEKKPKPPDEATAAGA